LGTANLVFGIVFVLIGLYLAVEGLDWFALFLLGSLPLALLTLAPAAICFIIALYLLRKYDVDRQEEKNSEDNSEKDSEKEMKQIVEPKKEEEKMSQSTWIKSLIAVGVIAVVLTIIVVSDTFPLMFQQTESEQQEQTPQPVKSTTSEDYSGNARSFTGKVTGIINGDTIQVDGQSVRLALASTPEVNTPMGLAAKQYLLQICPIGSAVTVNEDDGQTEDSYDRIVALVKCNGVTLNAAVIEKGFGHLSFVNCDKSEFSDQAWSRC